VQDRRFSLAALWRAFGPGIVTGAADDDPSGIATYSQAGAQFGFGLAWTMFLTTPFMIAIQAISARIGSTTGAGLIGNARRIYPPWLVAVLVLLLLVANVINIAADLAAMGEATDLIVGGPAPLYPIAFGIFSGVLQVFVPYRRYAPYLKVLTFSLFAYVATAFSASVSWGEVLRTTVLPTFSAAGDYWLTVVAVLGTTISPYLFFWQASQEVEEAHLRKEAGLGTLPSREAQARIRQIDADTAVGMVFSNLIGFFIIVTTAATLHAQGVTGVATAAQAAEALRPLAGQFTFLIFAAGIIGTGLLAVPVLAGSAAYAVAGIMGWRDSLELRPREARGFYAIVSAATLFGVLLGTTGIDAIQMLFWSAVVNGFVAVPIMVIMMGIVRSHRLMGSFVAGRLLTAFGWGATLAMLAPVVVLLVTLVL
jgi:NRAMP (natural resistance-associated macrophage protein)-like metal ion transporter